MMIIKPFFWVFFIIGSGFLISCSSSKPVDIFDAGAIASPDAYGAIAGEEVLARGGNAVDAAIAMAFTLAVTYPEAGVLGGGGLMTLWIQGNPYVLDYLEMAEGNVAPHISPNDQPSKPWVKSVAVPGTVAGLFQAHERFGSLPWKSLLAPAIQYAKNGFLVPPSLVKHYRDVSEGLSPHSPFVEAFASLQEGKFFKQPNLALVLSSIAQRGPSGFYSGWVAPLMVNAVGEEGYLRLEDLSHYRAYWRDVLRRPWNGMDVFSVSLPSAGGVALLQLLSLKSILADSFRPMVVDSPSYLNLLAHIQQILASDRDQYLSDPGFADDHSHALLTSSYLKSTAKQILSRESQKNAPSSFMEIQNSATIHFSVVDRYGNAVSNSMGSGGYFGSQVMVSGAGFVLNRELAHFSKNKNSQSNDPVFSPLHNSTNAIMPYERPISWMAPTIITKNDQVVMVLGGEGGATSVWTLFQVLAHIYDEHRSLSKAILAPRAHFQASAAKVMVLEGGLDTPVMRSSLQSMGYKVQKGSTDSSVQAVQILGKKLFPAADSRGRGIALLVFNNGKTVSSRLPLPDFLLGQGKQTLSLPKLTDHRITPPIMAKKPQNPKPSVKKPKPSTKKKGPQKSAGETNGYWPGL